MSTLLTASSATSRLKRDAATTSVISGLGLSAALTPLSAFILGYHPFAEDGGLYLAGVKYLLRPSLFAQQRAFVTAPISYSLFSPFLALLVRHSSLPFEGVVFLVFLLCLWATIFAAWSLATFCFHETPEQVGATFLVALWLSLPAAGTSLMLIDPYLTARSFSTPCVLLAIAASLRALSAFRSQDRSRGYLHTFACLVALIVAAIFHPLMAGYGIIFVASLLWISMETVSSVARRSMVLLLSGILLAAYCQHLAPLPTPAFHRVALTRSYWYLREWQWFEVVGLVAPMLILLAATRSRLATSTRPLLLTSVVVGCTASIVALLFARVDLAPGGVAHLQPLRIFQLIYFMLLLLLGAHLGGLLLHRRRWAWTLATVLLAIPVLIPSYLLFPKSRHLELPPHATATSPNPWVQAFDWIKHNTPEDALFALDAEYISEPEEDAQSFRAIAERSALPDYSKDGGETAVNAALAPAWAQGADAQHKLSSLSDSERVRVLKPFGVSWVVLRNDAVTLTSCSYSNDIVKVCRLP